MSANEGILNQFAPLFEFGHITQVAVSGTAGSTAQLTEGAYLMSCDVGVYISMSSSAQTATAANSIYLPAGVYPLDVRTGVNDYLNHLQYDSAGSIWLCLRS